MTKPAFPADALLAPDACISAYALWAWRRALARWLGRPVAQAELARALGCHRQYVQQMESGARPVSRRAAAGLRQWAGGLKKKGGEMNLPLDGVDLISIERRRQKTAEGWSDSHDDDHGDGGLALAASCYAQISTLSENARARFGPASIQAPNEWPWDCRHWKPSRPVRDLVKAGALIAAEIDRRLRAGEAP